MIRPTINQLNIYAIKSKIYQQNTPQLKHIQTEFLAKRHNYATAISHEAKSTIINLFSTFSYSAGRRRRNPLALYTEDDGHDLSDLGIGTSSTKSSLSEDCDTHSLASDGIDLDKNHSDVDNLSNCDTNRKLGSSANEYDTCTTTTISSPEPEEYTYEGAIEGYKSRIISQTNSTIVKTVVNNNFKEKSPEKNGDLNRIRTNVSNKIEEKLSSFQQERANDAKNNNQKKDLPKVDIHKRREQFERENSQEPQANKPKLPDIANKKSIKERLSSLEKFTEDSHIQKSTSDLTKLPTEVKPLKERLSSLEKVKSTEPEKVKRLSNGDLSNTRSLKERLSSLKSQTSEEETKATKTEVKEVSMSLKERLSCLDAAKNKEIPKISVEEELAHNKDMEIKVEEPKETLMESSLKSSLSGIESQMQSFCRSLDSLDINGQTSPNSFDRVQSLEDFDCAEMQNNTVPSDIETEDSGIHTARDSCAPADDIADLTQVASPVGEPMIEASEYESSNEDGTAMDAKIEEMDKMPEPIQLMQDIIVEETEEQDAKTDDDSASNYLQAVSQPEELSVTEVTEIQLDKDDEDTLKSLENQDTSVSLNEPVSTGSESDTVVFEGKMTIHLNLNEICNNMSGGAGTTNNVSSTNSMPMVTVSNITTITNISPKNSVKALKSNDIPDLSYTSECSLVKLDNSPNHNTVSIKDIHEPRDVAAARGEVSVIDALELAFKELDSEDSAALDDTTELQKTDDFIDKKIDVTPLYENMDIFYQNSSEFSPESAFPLDMPTNVLEPPKEKPPPPPTEDGPEDELLGNGNFKHTSSARRIKKEIRNKRTSFLGIEGQDDSYLDVDLTLAPRPDITSFLQEETKIEKLLYKKTLSHDMDAKLRESRDSGVDVDRGPSAEAWYKGHSSPETSSPHSRQNSEPYTHVTVTSDEEESTKKQQETFSSNLNSKLSELTEPSDKIDNLDKTIQQQQEVLRFERELLQLEQEELRRQRENLLRDQTRIIQKSVQDISSIPTSPEKPPLNRTPANPHYRHSMPNLLLNENIPSIPPAVPERQMDERMVDEKRKPFVSEEHMQRHFGVEESRRVLYERKEVRGQPMRVPQPVLPPKPKSRESIEREITMRSSRVPSAVEYANVQLRQKPVPNGNAANYHPMTRHTLQEAEQRRLDEQRSKARAQRHSYHHEAPPTVLAAPPPVVPPTMPPTAAAPAPAPLYAMHALSTSLLGAGRGAAMIIESLSLCYHVWCFTCAVCGARLGDGRAGADVRVRSRRLHCQHCYSSDDGRKYSAV
ncbi:hypothetical protein HF086_006023 [Spodoptera exigua]|uniref:LIM zinc-binding domain-containing protein n=1 Tax=Spodoptera exigua TaxID=7107 RepID=A0A922MXZ5_SPOEX|nr:hypothetical protein HF086_006023 [Spodoptera exigua]